MSGVVRKRCKTIAPSIGFNRPSLTSHTYMVQVHLRLAPTRHRDARGVGSRARSCLPRTRKACEACPVRVPCRAAACARVERPFGWLRVVCADSGAGVTSARDLLGRVICAYVRARRRSKALRKAHSVLDARIKSPVACGGPQANATAQARAHTGRSRFERFVTRGRSATGATSL